MFTPYQISIGALILGAIILILAGRNGRNGRILRFLLDPNKEPGKESPAVGHPGSREYILMSSSGNYARETAESEKVLIAREQSRAIIGQANGQAMAAIAAAGGYALPTGRGGVVTLKLTDQPVPLAIMPPAPAPGETKKAEAEAGKIKTDTIAVEEKKKVEEAQAEFEVAKKELDDKKSAPRAEKDVAKKKFDEAKVKLNKAKDDLSKAEKA